MLPSLGARPCFKIRSCSIGGSTAASWIRWEASFVSHLDTREATNAASVCPCEPNSAVSMKNNKRPGSPKVQPLFCRIILISGIYGRHRFADGSHWLATVEKGSHVTKLRRKFRQLKRIALHARNRRKAAGSLYLVTSLGLVLAFQNCAPMSPVPGETMSVSSKTAASSVTTPGGNSGSGTNTETPSSNPGPPTSGGNSQGSTPSPITPPSSGGSQPNPGTPPLPPQPPTNPPSGSAGTPAGVGATAGLTMDDLWDGRAQFNPIAKVNFPFNADGYIGSANQVVAVNGVWYAILRRQYNVTSPICDGVRVDQVIMSSRYKGKTWSGPYTIVQANSQVCQYTDGSIYYDAQTNQWIALTQCLMTADSKWNMCAFTQAGADPTAGAWFGNPSNPVVRGGSLWSRICQESGKCPTSVSDEGTPHILTKRNGFYYVSFHGFLNPRGFRGMAKTMDFVNYVTSAPDLPSGPIYDDSTCNPIIPGCIGGGHASMLGSPNYTYMLIEAPTRTLICEKDQSWTFVLARTSNLYQSQPGWSHFQNKSFLVNQLKSPIGCHVAYANLFVDNGQIFMTFNFFSRNPAEWMPLAVYQLVSRDTPVTTFADRDQLLTDLIVERAPAPITAPRVCSLNGTQIPIGQSITAYAQSTVPAGQTCAFEIRTCRQDGTLSGSYGFAACTPQVAPMIQSQTFINPTVGWVNDPQGANRAYYPSAAWVAFTQALGDQYCNAYRSGWVADMGQSVSTTVDAFVCNIRLEQDGIGTSGLYCSNGVSGSYQNGRVYSSIRCRER
jgi:hypothetical protein